MLNFPGILFRIDGPDKEEAAGGTEDKASESGKEGETDVEVKIYPMLFISSVEIVIRN